MNNKDVLFSAEEIFEIAKKIEENGEKFYRLAAKACPTHSDFLLKMAEEEKGHKSTFTDMAQDLIGDGNFFLQGATHDGVLEYLNSFSDTSVFNILEDPEEIFKTITDPEVIFKQALAREGDAILFFLGMKELAVSDKAKDALEALIREEMGHITWIKNNFPK